MGLLELSQASSVRPIVPDYFTFADYPWLRGLLDERARYVGQRRREWRARTSEPLPWRVPGGKLRMALDVLDRCGVGESVSAPVAPRAIRSLLFRRAVSEVDRARALASTAHDLGISEADMQEALFADLADERRLLPVPMELDPTQLALRCNEALVSGLLHKALQVRIALRGQARAVVRHAKCVGLLCDVASGEGPDAASLVLSGPYALFRHTRLYGRALTSLVFRLAHCDAYRLEADCVLGSEGRVGRLVLQSGDPIAPARELPRFDSRVEERFAKDFGRLAREWEILREPRAIQLSQALVFPDFELRHRATGRSWLVEIVGYWTPTYLTRKLAQLRALSSRQLVVCIDENLRAADGELAGIGHVVRYKRRVDARAVIAIVDPGLFERLPSLRGR